MHTLYNIAIHIATFCLWVSQIFSKKMRTFVKGRKTTFSTLTEQISATDQTFWFHCASLGEFEQGLPIMEAMRRSFPSYKIVISFFSPSGYEIKKNTPIADCVVYLPMDTPANAHKFIKLAHPTLALFVKYEFWPNYLFQLKKQKIPSVLIAGLFRNEQVFFKSYGNFMRKALASFNHIFVQNARSQELLESIHIQQVSLSGDTRFDRVSQQIEQNNKLEFMESFLGNALCVVCGSTWVEDENVLLSFINEAPQHVKFVIAPHKIDPAKIDALRKKLKQPSHLYSGGVEDQSALENTKILIIDTIGLLTKIYSYADVAYVGGAMGSTGLHNILEAATFGVPVLIGQHYKEFPEAIRLQSLAGLFSVKNAEECSAILTKLTTNTAFRNKTGMIAGHFVNSNTGATAITLVYIEKLMAEFSKR
ncbi:3-deoxy-D-manno-octulosonic acid transferase [Rasiella rasia]|uniref:3-deoxy-D-manno-octulosonic acid transferase n=2 Tax=Rasiella rasia TaxID=2744027 RepID=A0A6G6GP12_9FLAO|nr:3-deoxy-D-manno-octulosonic acid transferase [Rasiella rasia]